MKPISFNADMVRAILSNRKTVPWRVVKTQHEVLIKIENGGVYYANYSGEWSPVEGNPRFAKQRLYGRDGRTYLFSNEICRVWPEGIYGLVSAERASRENGISFNLNLSREQEEDNERTQSHLQSIPRRKAGLRSSEAHGRESVKQCTGKSDAGDCERELERQEASQHSDCWIEAPNVKIDGCPESRNCGLISLRDEPTENCIGLLGESICYLENIKIPFGVGQTLYVRETFQVDYLSNIPGTGRIRYKADDTYRDFMFAPERYEMMRRAQLKPGWRPSGNMPKEAARIFLRVTDVWVEKIREMTDAEASKEGFLSKEDFIANFLKIYPKYYLDSWVWRIEFDRTEKPPA